LQGGAKGKKNKFRAPLFSLYAARDRGRRRGKAFSPLFSRAVSAYFQKCEKKGVPFFEKSGPPANFFRFFSEISAAVPENIPRFGGTLSEKVALLFFISLHERFYPFAAGFFISCGASAYNRRNRFLKKGARSMRLYNEILKKFDGGEAGELFAGTRYTVLPGRGGYFQGVKTVSEFSPCRIVVCFRHAVLEIEGSGFVIEKYCDGDLELSGQIVSVRLDGA